MADIIGRSVIEVGADTTQLNAGMAQAAQTVQNFENAATDAAKGVGGAFQGAGNQVEGATQKLDATTKRFINSLERESMAAGRTRSEYLELRAAKMGIADQAAPLIARLREQEIAQKAAADAARAEAAAVREAAKAKQVGAQAFNAYGMSAKQTTAALRQVPAQITDIFVSLAGGQNPMMVLLQQGGQLKDIFGGIVPAARALGGAVVGLINPFTIAATAVGALGFAYYKGSEQANEYYRAIQAGGGAAGVSTAGLAQLAAQVGDTADNFAGAREAAAALAESGIVGMGNLSTALRGVVAGAEVTKKSISEMVAIFVEIQKDPIEAITKLNQKYNFLTADVYNNVRALQEQGRTQEAATAAFNAFATAMETRQGKMVENLGNLERGWRAIKNEISGAVDNLMSWGRAQTDDRALVQAQNRLRSLQQAAGPGGGAPGTRIAALIAEAEQEVNIIQRRIGAENRLADERARQAQSLNAAVAAENAINKTIDEGATKQQKLNSALKEFRQQLDTIRAANPASEALRPENIAKAEAAIRNRFRDTSTKTYQEDAATRLLGTLREQEAALRAQLGESEKLGTSAKALAKFNQEIADIKEKKVLTADQKSLLANEGKIRTQLEVNARVEAQVAAEKKVTEELEKQKKLQDQLSERIRQIQTGLDAANEQRRGRFGEDLELRGMGRQAAERTRARQQIDAEFLRAEQQLARGTPRDLLGSSAYKDAVAEIKASHAEALADSQNYYDQLDVINSDWAVGASQVLQDYQDQVNNVAANTERVFTNAFKGMEDALVNFVMTGKLDFNSLANSIVADITRIIIQQQLLGLYKSLGAGGGGGAGGFFGELFGALMSPTGRAVGGPVQAGGLYEVNENMPELLNVRGRQFLMMGNESGKVTPMDSRNTAASRPIYVNVTAAQGMNRDTALQQGNRIGQGIKLAMGRNS